MGGDADAGRPRCRDAAATWTPGMGFSEEEEEEEEGPLWAAVPSITFLGFVLLLLVAVFPYWVRLEPPDSGDVLFSGPWGGCFRCRTPPVPSGACVVLAGLMHGLQMKELSRRPRAPRLIFLWPYSALGGALFLFLLTGFICLLNHLPFWRGLLAAANPAPRGGRTRRAGGRAALGRTSCSPRPPPAPVNRGWTDASRISGFGPLAGSGWPRVRRGARREGVGFLGGDNRDLWPGPPHPRGCPGRRQHPARRGGTEAPPAPRDGGGVRHGALRSRAAEAT
ncbi:uncharacterized protein LOC114807589 [Ornithorhynchus anatinus]|uniref:uncharacterized protein LOC114807589 n=1 Tax=Ornithorhynchus anatinus TaxID=9258 RepID=UPI0010A84C15|nr:uncharacterized protein LOC114807589 [Ornithorhynchus anatinus]